MVLIGLAVAVVVMGVDRDIRVASFRDLVRDCLYGRVLEWLVRACSGLILWPFCRLAGSDRTVSTCLVWSMLLTLVRTYPECAQTRWHIF